MRVMAIDYGDTRTGVAFSDLSGTLVGEAFTLTEKSRKLLLDKLTELAQSRAVTRIVVGNPKNMDGTAGARSELCRSFAEELQIRTSFPVELWDERRTTVEAHRILHEAGRHGRKNKGKVDAIAASLILEGYLASVGSHESLL